MSGPRKQADAIHSRPGRRHWPRFQYRLGTLLALVVLSAMGWGGFRRWLQGRESILVAAVDIQAGMQITPNLVAVAYVDSKLVPIDSIRTYEALESGDHIARMTIGRGMPIVRAVLTQPYQFSRASPLSLGHRAYSIPVLITDDAPIGVLRPRMQVDVVLQVDDIRSDADVVLSPSSVPLLYDVTLLAVGNELKPLDGTPPLYRNITLCVKPKDAQLLQTSAYRGSLLVQPSP